MKKKSLIFIIAFLISTNINVIIFKIAYAASIPRSDKKAEELFQQGNIYFDRANLFARKNPAEAGKLYLKAVRLFEQIKYEGGIRNGRLYYNIANSYFLAGDIGRAILNYCRAQQYIPDDPNLRGNFFYVRQQRIDSVDEKQQTQILKILFFWHYDLPMSVRAVLFIIFYILLWVLALWRLFRKQLEIRWGIIICVFFAVLFGSSLVISKIQISQSKKGVILESKVMARKGNAATYQSAFRTSLHAGTEFKLIEKRGQWFYIELTDGSRCWVPSNSSELIWGQTLITH